MLIFSSRLLTNDTSLFNKQGSKINAIPIIVIGPIKVDTRVVSHSEWLDHDANYLCCVFRSLFRFSKLSRNLAIVSLAIPVWSTYTQHFSLSAAHTPLCCKNIRSNSFQFCNTTSDSDLIDCSNALTDCLILARSLSTVILKALNSLFCCTKDATPVPIPAPLMIIRIAIVNAEKGSRFDR